ncbi:hypothetical protein DFH06DRAFT_1188829 [Mycena polygramma]|nr:hypothetical protein DFH06DRAFT_1188829 [Mycena polygramma]
MLAFKCPECGGLAPKDSAALCISATPGTRHHILLHGNEPPEESELPVIQSALSQADACLADLDEEIARLQDRLKQLEEERVSISSYRLRNRNVLSPLRRMPPEVLGKIFLRSLPVKPGWSLNLAASPWVLTHVNRRWRAVSLSTPSLWSRVTINYYGKARDLAHALALAEAQIQRSQNLKIHFHASGKFDSRPQIQMFQRSYLPSVAGFRVSKEFG